MHGIATKHTKIFYKERRDTISLCVLWLIAFCFAYIKNDWLTSSFTIAIGLGDGISCFVERLNDPDKFKFGAIGVDER